MDYISKFIIEDEKVFVSLFNKWAASKDFLKEDMAIILKLAREHYKRKAEETKFKKSGKSRRHKNKIDTNQSEFDFSK